MSSDPLLPPDSEPKPTPPSGEPLTPFATGSVQTTSVGLEPNVAAGLSVVLTLVSGLVFLVLEKRNTFVRFWAMQAVFFGATWFIEGIVANVIGWVVGRIPVIGWLWVLFALLITLGFVAVWLYMLFQAFTGKTWELPILGKMARQQLSKQPPVS